MPRIIAGTRKKMILKAPHGNKARPTSDRIKENVFNIIGSYVPEADFLDLFAGTGQIGLEAMSRGARSCVFVEKNYGVFMVLKENIDKGRFDNTHIIKGDSLSYIENCDMKFDLIYIDPPFASGVYEDVLERISRRGILKDGGKIIIEHSLNVEINEKCGILIKYKEEKYASTMITFMGKE